jgi:hypothetical protein
VNDTSEAVARLVVARYAAMSPLERMQIASSMYDTARLSIESSLPAGLSREERRYAVAKRMYGAELPDSALRAHAAFQQV